MSRWKRNRAINVHSVRPGPVGLFAGPWLVGAILLITFPAVVAFALSATRFDGANWSSMQWIGADHYESLTGWTDVAAESDDPWWVRVVGCKPRDPLFWQSLYNTLAYSVFAAPLSVAFALILAWLLHGPVRGAVMFRTVYYLPHVLGGVATVLIWSWILNPRFGPVNAVIRGVYATLDPILAVFGGSSSDWSAPGWFMSPTWCKPGLVLMNVWTAGGAMFVFLAAMSRLDPQLDDAARVDGASSWRRFRAVTIPLLTPVILFNLLTGISASMQAFNQAYLLQNRAQQDGLLLLPLLIYRSAFETPYRFGYASAMACILFGLLAIVGALTLRSARHWVYYES